MPSVLELPDVMDHEAELVPSRTLGDAPEEIVRRRISIGRSEAIPLTLGTAGIEPELAQWLERDSASRRYHLVQLSCTFRPADQPILESVFAVQLSAPAGPTPVVWSMDPQKLTTPRKHRRVVTLSTRATIIPELIGLEGSMEKTEEQQSDDYHVVAAGEGEPTAEWFFRRTPTVELVGIYRLVLVVRTVREASTTVDIALQAKVRRRLGGVIPYRARLPQAVRQLQIDPDRETWQ